jgi:hypothetical protein
LAPPVVLPLSIAKDTGSDKLGNAHVMAEAMQAETTSKTAVKTISRLRLEMA